MDENLRSMGDTGKANFKEEVIVDDINTVVEDKTVEDVIKEKEVQVEIKKDEAIIEERKTEAQKKAEEFFWHKQEEVGQSIKVQEETLDNTKSNDLEWKLVIEKAKQAVEAAKRIKKAYEERETIVLSESKNLKTDLLEKEIEIKSLRAKIEEMANEKAHDSNNLIKTNDMRLRYLANIRNRRIENPEDPVLKAKEIEYLVDELSIFTPHITPEQLRNFITKKEESIEVMPNGKDDYIASANKIVEDRTSERKKESLIRTISSKKSNYNY